jgi:hypothetical protein
MGVAEYFSAFCNNLTVLNRETISLRYRAITTRLNLDFWGWESDSLHCLYSGSYDGQGTAIRSLSDLDLIFWLQRHRFQSKLAFIWKVEHPPPFTPKGYSCNTHKH